MTTLEESAPLLAAVFTLFAALASAAVTILTELSWGTIHRLEEEELTEPARIVEHCLENRSRILIRFHLLQGLLVFGLIMAILAWFGRSASAGTRPLTACALGLLAYFLVSEGLGRALPLKTAARFLGAAVTASRGLAVLLFPIAFAVAAWEQIRGRVRAGDDLEETTAEDEIRSLVEQDAQHDKEGEEPELEDDERRMIRGVFDLDVTQVRVIMTPRVDVHALPIHADFATVRNFIVETGHSRIPLYRKTIDQIVGIIHAKDLLDNQKVEAAGKPADMVHAPLFIPETKNIGDLLSEFQEKGQQFAVVLDEYGGTAGIVTIEDILEEIVGEIRDEYDAGEENCEISSEANGAFVVDARIAIDDLEKEIGLDLPDDEDYDTLGGYIAARTGTIPAKGERIETETHIIEILEADARRVEKVRIRPKPAETDS